ncbi:hypothetical protein COO91_02261 [Nostoc flagelliforme CCNUN1]|uniref:Uncharacterized protein n=1 Tax=Nostoc flagelliforme CCNUN1 TaxID=2038116 RepID=A0A2K8SLN8_9NOSO|nr:hypothetical protein COO91_02261 [Nostoc flagelliforme CCNUN1]
MTILYICKVSSIHQQTFIGKGSPQEIPTLVLSKLLFFCGVSYN